MSAWMIALAVFAAIGVAFVVVSIVKGCLMIVGILRNLAETLRQAVGIAKELRSDFNFLRVLASGQQAAAQAEEGESSTGQAMQKPIPFPTPVFERFQTKPPEPDAPIERADDVDVTPTDDEVVREDALDELRKLGMRTEALEEEFRSGRGAEAD